MSAEEQKQEYADIAAIRKRYREAQKALSSADMTVAERNRQGEAHDRAALALSNLTIARAIRRIGREARRRDDDGSFWMRRYFTSLVVGNGAFLTLAVTRLQEAGGKLGETVAPFMIQTLSAFVLGLGFAGLLPVVIALWKWGHEEGANGGGVWARRASGVAAWTVVLLTLISTFCLATGVWMILKHSFFVTVLPAD